MLGFLKKSTKVVAPVTGKVVDLSDVPDVTFSERMIGNGVAIDPSGDSTVVAPIDGVVQSIFRTNHAFGIKAEGGQEMIVHCGVDTVKLNGEGFERLIEEGSKVTAGTPILKVDWAFLKEKGCPIVTPVLFTSDTDEKDLVTNVGISVAAGKDVIMELKK